MVRLWRSVLVASTLALGAATGPGIAANAVDNPVMAPATSGRQVIATHVRCPNSRGQASYDCTAVLTFHADRHLELPLTPLASNTALACSGTYYLNWWTSETLTNGIGTTLIYVKMTGQDSYNFCSAGNVYINRAACTTDLGYQCDGWRQGSFWDGGKNANTDWGNQQTHVTVTGTNFYKCVWLRWWTHPDGTWSHSGGITDNGGGYTC